MDFVRRHRRFFLIAFSVIALASMTYGFLRRVGVDVGALVRPRTTEPRSGD